MLKNEYGARSLRPEGGAPTWISPTRRRPRRDEHRTLLIGLRSSCLPVPESVTADHYA
ncbi:MAG: hypothetical protein ABW185_01545 [Sedimenticola sp.]